MDVSYFLKKTNRIRNPMHFPTSSHLALKESQ
jgi:hypothetical protein